MLAISFIIGGGLGLFIGCQLALDTAEPKVMDLIKSHFGRTDELIESVLIGGNHLANVLIGNDIMPDEINSYDEIEDVYLRDVWIAWRAIMDLSEAEHG